MAAGLLFSVLIVSLLVSLLSLSPSRTQQEGEVPNIASAKLGPGEVAPGRSGLAAGRGLTLASGESGEIATSSLKRGEPFELNLRLPAVAAGVESLPVRVLAEDGRVLEIAATIRGEDRDLASVEIAGEWLASTGRYVVEVRTSEQTHFPLRRYAFEVR